jgi:hypothetical protein
VIQLLNEAAEGLEVGNGVVQLASTFNQITGTA